MKIPKFFQLAGIKWTVEETSAMNEMGHCDPDGAVIRIKAGLSKQAKESTFCHELQHAIRFATGKRTDHDEVEVEAQALMLHQFLESSSGRL